MRLRHVSLLGLFAAACTSGHDAGDIEVHVVPSFVIPQDVFTNIKSISLSVYDGTTSGVTCDTTTGIITNPNTATATATANLMSTGCASPYKWCGTLNVTESNDTDIFQAIGKDGANQTIGEGCASATVNQSSLPLNITMERFVAPATCGNTTIESTEQCEKGSPAFYCNVPACQTIEVLLSNGVTANGTNTGAKGDKFNASFLWPESSGTNGRFFAFFTDKTSGYNNIGVRSLSDSWIDLATPPLAAVGEFYLPNGSAAPGSPVPAPGTNDGAASAFSGGSYYVAFEESSPASMGQDIHVRVTDSALTAGQAINAALVMNGTACTDATTCTGELAIQSSPAIAAGAGGTFFVAWQNDGMDGAIYGRLFTPSTNALGPQLQISTGTSNTKVQLAATSTGWTAVWQSGDDVKMRNIGANGQAAGQESVVNSNTAGLQDHPSIASLADGRFAVVFADHNPKVGTGADIFIQRFSASGMAVANDQMTAVNNVVAMGDQTLPRIAASSAANGSFLIAWLDGTTTIRARIADGSSGFLPNNVDGQDGEFQASIAANRTRTNPVVVTGGSGPNFIVGWEDITSATGAGIVARLFPAPSQ